MAQENEDAGITRKYTNSPDTSDQATQQYDTGMASPGRTDAHLVHGLSEGDTVALKGNSYTIERLLSMTGAEAIVYIVRNEKNEPFVLKLYYPFQIPGDEPNAEALERIKKLQDPNILRLYDYGTGKSKFRDKFCYEVIEFARGGDLLNFTDRKFKKKYTPEFIEKNVIPEILAGIRTLHQNKIYHGDLKPHNVFFLDEDQNDIVIGDYGSSKTFEQASGKSLAYTVMSKGTNFYISPEQARGIISEKNDFYSFGMILLHLLYPELVNQSTLRKIVERQFSKKPIIDYSKKFGRLNDLIAGLTLQDLDARWGEAEVERWMQGESMPVRYSGEIVVESKAVIKLGKTTVHTADDLIQYLKASPEWHDMLIKDPSGKQLLYNWIAETYDLERKNTFKKMVQNYENIKDGDAVFFVRESIIRFLQPRRPIFMQGTEFDFFESTDPVQLLNEYLSALDDLWKSSRSISTVKNYIFLLEFSLRKLEGFLAGGAKARITLLLDKISAVLNVKPGWEFRNNQAVFYTKVTNASVLELFYAFNPERVFRDEKNNSISDVKNIALYFAANTKLYRDHKMIAERNIYFKKIGSDVLVDAVYEDFIFHALSDHTKANMEILNFQPQGKKHAITIRIYKNLNEYFQSSGVDPEKTGLAGGIPALEQNALRIFSENSENRVVAASAGKIANAEEKWEQRKKRKKEKKQSKKETVPAPDRQRPKENIIQLPDSDEDTFLNDFWAVIEAKLHLPESKFSELNVNHVNKTIQAGLGRYRAAVQHAIEVERVKNYKTRMMSFFIPTSAVFPFFFAFTLATIVFGKLHSDTAFSSFSLPAIEDSLQKLKQMDNLYPWTKEAMTAEVVIDRGFEALAVALFLDILYLLSLLPAFLFYSFWEPDNEFKWKFISKNIIPLNPSGFLIFTFLFFPVTVTGFANFPRLYLYFHLLSMVGFSGIYFYNSLMASQKGYRVIAEHYVNFVGINTEFNKNLAVPAVISGIVFAFFYAVIIDLFL